MSLFTRQPHQRICISTVSFCFVLMVSAGTFSPEVAADDKNEKSAADEKAKPQEDKPKAKLLSAGTPMTNSIGMKFAPVPSGEFLMGSTNEFGRLAHEHQHKVMLSKGFFLGVYEVTQAQYEKVIGKNPSFFSSTGEGKDRVEGETADYPVENVSWHDAVEFCRLLSELPEEKAAGRSYRLPTEAEWEYACRAGSTTPFHYGESLASTQANFDGNHPYLTRADVIAGESPEKLKGPYLKRPTKVGSYEPNSLGIYDMHGNVWEWVSDWYSPVYYKSSPAEDPTGPQEGDKKVSRGGGWYYFGAAMRSAARYDRAPDEKRRTDGFRVVCVGPDVKSKVQRF